MSFWAVVGWGVLAWLGLAALCVWGWARMPLGGDDMGEVSPPDAVGVTGIHLGDSLQ